MAYSDEVYEDLAEAAEFIDEVVFQRRLEVLKDKHRVEDITDLVDRLNGRLSMLDTPFERKIVNSRLGKGEHLLLMHQQM